MLKAGVAVSHQRFKKHSSSFVVNPILKSIAFLLPWQEELTANLTKLVDLFCVIM